MLNYANYFSPLFFPYIPSMNQKPPTVYSLLESIVNYGKDEKTKIKDLASVGRTTFFDFEYPLSQHINKANFETMILNKFLMRRIGYETLTAFKIQLNVKLNSIMPIYNKMFDSLENWNLFTDGEIETKQGANTTNTTNTLSNTSTTQNQDVRDRRQSDTPQDQLENIRDGKYVDNYEYEQNSANSTDNSTTNGSSSNNNIYNETISRSPADKIALYKEFQENINSIYEMIFKDLDCLFYQLV